jgi:hypothetical protein
LCMSMSELRRTAKVCDQIGGALEFCHWLLSADEERRRAFHGRYLTSVDDSGKGATAVPTSHLVWAAGASGALAGARDMLKSLCAKAESQKPLRAVRSELEGLDTVWRLHVRSPSVDENVPPPDERAAETALRASETVSTFARLLRETERDADESSYSAYSSESASNTEDEDDETTDDTDDDTCTTDGEEEDDPLSPPVPPSPPRTRRR